MRILLLPALLFLAILSASCKKASEVQPESIVPQATQTGSGLVYFKMDGKDYPGTYTGWAAQEVYMGYSTMWISLFSNQRAFTRDIVLNCDSIVGVGTYKIGIGKGEFYPIVIDRTKDCHFFNNLRSDNCSGWVKVTRADTQKRICSGMFEIKVWNDNSNCDTIRVSSGIFDLSEI